MKRDGLSQRVRAGREKDKDRFQWWIEGSGRRLVHESERIRLAICPGVRKFVRLFEGLATGEATM